MPLVNVYYDVTSAGDPMQKLRDTLATEVAYRLNVGDVPKIAPDDVTIIFHMFSPYDVHKHDVIIEVTAHNFPERVSAQKEIVKGIGVGIVSILRNFSYVIIVNLTPLEWSSYKPS